MKKVEIVISLVTMYAIFFHAAPFIGLDAEMIISLYVLSPFLVVYMVYVVLKNGQPSNHTFDERFYDDWDYERNGKEALDNPG